MNMTLDPETRLFRFLLLLLNCLICFGLYFCYDMPSVLQKQIQGNCTCGNTSDSGGNVSCFSDCLGLNPDQFNLLYAVWSWTGAATVFFNGLLIDKIGNKASAIIFGSMVTAASVVFAAATLDGVRGSPFMLPLLIIARVLFGVFSGSLCIVQDRLTSFWFKDKELSMAFGATISSTRFGGVLNFLITESIAVRYGISWALWGGAAFCGLGLICGFLATHLDAYGVKKLGLSEVLKDESKDVHISDVKEFNLQFWLLSSTIYFFYGSIVPFIADASLYIQEKYDIDEITAGYIAGAVFATSVILSPILGYITDIFGGSGYASIISCVLAVPVFVLLALTRIPPLAATLWLGVLYSLAAISLWSRIPYLVKRQHIGSAMGMANCFQALGTGFSNLIVGKILGNSNRLDYSERQLRWKLIMIPLAASAFIGSIFIIAVNIIDKQRGGVMNRRNILNASSDAKTLRKDSGNLKVN